MATKLLISWRLLLIMAVSIFMLIKCQSTSESTSSTMQQLTEAIKDIKNQMRQQQRRLEAMSAQLSDLKCSQSVQLDKWDPATELRESCKPLLIQQNVNGSDLFNRSWKEYKVGFSDSNGNFWLGNELLSRLSLYGNYKLRVELLLTDEKSWYYREYINFIVYSEESNYKMFFARVSAGNAAKDALDSQNRMMFTTYDRDNDQWHGGNCAAKNGGGFWYSNCGNCTINSMRDAGDGFRWFEVSARRNGPTTFTYASKLQSSRMWLLCQQ